MIALLRQRHIIELSPGNVWQTAMEARIKMSIIRVAKSPSIVDKERQLYFLRRAFLFNMGRRFSVVHFHPIRSGN